MCVKAIRIDSLTTRMPPLDSMKRTRPRVRETALRKSRIFGISKREEALRVMPSSNERVGLSSSRMKESFRKASYFETSCVKMIWVMFRLRSC